MQKPLRFALMGTGFWSRFQLAGWYELDGVECVALYNRSREKAKQLAASLNIPVRIYDDAAQLLHREDLDFVDIVTNVEMHHELVMRAACHRLPVICQKPMTINWPDAESMVDTCRRQNTPLFIHENWRWQTPIRKLKELLSTGALGMPYRARIRMASAYPVFENQPFLKNLEQFLLMDIGSHILDVARFLFGEPSSIYCAIKRVQKNICGEDVATVVLHNESGADIICEMAYAGTPMEHDFFPQTFAYVECENGSIELAPNYWLRVTTKGGVQAIHAPPPHFSWADPFYEVVHASIVDCHKDLLSGLLHQRAPETTGEDNLKTMRLVFSAYESAATNQVISL